MKKLILLALLLTSVLSYATPPSLTVVSATLQDTTGQVWFNGTWQAIFVPPFNNPSPANNNGNTITANQSGTTDSLGHFSVTLDDNTVVAPTGSKWRFILCPNASVLGCTTIETPVSGASEDISSILNPLLTPITVGVSPTIIRTYQDSQANGGYGALYQNTTDNTMRQCQALVCHGSGWVIVSVSSVNPVFTGTVTAQCFKYKLSSSDSVLVCGQVGSGNIAINLPTLAGTIPSTAASPIVLNPVTGEISCPTCSTGTGFPLFAPDSLSTAPQYSFTSAHGTGFSRDTATGDLVTGIDGFATPPMSVSGTIIRFLAGATLCFSNGSPLTHVCSSEIVSSGDNINLHGNGGSTSTNVTTGGEFISTAAIGAQMTEAATPTAPVSSVQKIWAKAGSGICSIDNGSTTYCMVPSTTSFTTILAESNTTCSLCPVSVGNAETTVISKAVTFPSSGCPCRIFASYTLYFETGNSGADGSFVTDATDRFAWGGNHTTGAVNGGATYTVVGSGWSPNTYANGASKTFTIKAENSHAGSASALATVGTDLTDSGHFLANLNLVIVSSN